MRVFRSPSQDQLPPARRVVALGSFDGLHRGHQAVLNRTTALAHKHQATSLALTFDPPPGLYFNHSGKQRLLTTLDQKTRLIEKQGLDEIVILDFDASLASLPAEQFARQVLKDTLNAFLVTCGPGHRLGAAGAGDCLSLVSAGCSLSAEIVPPVNYAGQPISSTRVRDFIAKGDLPAAADCLGRLYSITGTQVAGEGRGASLGFPTINLRWNPLQQLPPPGVYACQVSGLESRVSSSESRDEGPSQAIAGSHTLTGHWSLATDHCLSWAAVSLGTKPTFDAHSLSLEVHFLDRAPDNLPGQEYEVFFVKYLRGQIRFETVEALREQIAQDCLAVRQVALRAGP